MTDEKDDIIFMQARWANLMDILKKQFGKNFDMEGILFMIGVREIGVGWGKFTKEEKVDLMHIAICAILAPAGYYKLSHLDQEGWPHWEQLQPLPAVDIFSQELFLKSHIIDYFAEIYDL